MSTNIYCLVKMESPHNDLKDINIMVDMVHAGVIKVSYLDRVSDVLNLAVALVSKKFPRFVYGMFGLDFSVNEWDMMLKHDVYNNMSKDISDIWDVLDNAWINLNTKGSDIHYRFGKIIEKYDNKRFVLVDNGLFSKKGSSASMIGRRDNMEDEHSYNRYSKGNITVDIYSLFDGHAGRECSELLNRELPSYIISILDTIDLKNVLLVRKSLIDAFIKFDKDLYRRKYDISNSGSTAHLIIILKHQLSRGRMKYDIYMANLGDSRGLLVARKYDGSLNIIMESVDHKPDDFAEQARIEKSGGYTTILGVSRVNGYLAVSRAFGDFTDDYALKEKNGKYTGIKSPVSPEPDIYFYTFITGTSDISSLYIIIACDGLWDVMSSSEVLKFMEGYIGENKYINLPNDLANESIWKNSTDNVSIIFSEIFSSKISFNDKYPNLDIEKITTDIFPTSLYINIQQCRNGQILLDTEYPNHLLKTIIYPDSMSKNVREHKVLDEFRFQLEAARHNIAPMPLKIYEFVLDIIDDNQLFYYGIMMEKMDSDLIHILRHADTDDSIIKYMLRCILSHLSNLYHCGIWHGYLHISNIHFKCGSIYITNFKYASHIEISQITFRKYLSEHLNTFFKSILQHQIKPQILNKVKVNYKKLLIDLNIPSLNLEFEKKILTE